MMSAPTRPHSARWFEHAALRLHALHWAGDGDPVLCIHGAGGHARWWEHVVPWWEGREVLAPDLRGHGESAAAARYLVEDFADDCLAIVDAWGHGRVVLVGHSMGGRVAAWIAAHHPQRVRGLVLLDARLGAVPRERAERWRDAKPADAAPRRYATRAEAEAAFRLTPAEPDVDAARHASLAQHAVRQADDGSWRMRFDRAVLRLESSRVDDLLPTVARIRCPTLALRGADSTVIGAAQDAALRAALPAVTQEVMPGGHHFLLVHGQRVGMRVAAFLAALGCSAR